jgi:hypothetical protein
MSGDTPVWRYLTLSAVIATIKTQHLRLTRVDRFQDPFEGSVPKKQIEDQILLLGGAASRRMMNRIAARWTSARGWESAKKRLGFGKVTQDGDCEGSIVLDRWPSKAEAAEIRDILGIPKRVELSEGQLANLREHAAANAFKPVLPASGDERATVGP